MSFSDLPRRPGGTVAAYGGPSAQPAAAVSASTGNDLQSVGEALQSYEKLTMRVKERVFELRRRGGKVGLAEKQELDGVVRSLKETELRVKGQLDTLARQAESLPRSEAASRRIAVGKLLKDFERVRALVQTQINEVGLIKVSAAAGDGGGGGGNLGVFRTGRGPDDFNLGDGASGGEGSKPAVPKLIQTLQGQDVDDLILEERERDIRKMNQDLQLVHEMFQDMANIVDQQGEMIEEISDMTEKSHNRAQAGLEQVKQAAAYQPSCTVA